MLVPGRQQIDARLRRAGADAQRGPVEGIVPLQSLRIVETAERTVRMTVSDLPTAEREIPAAIAAAGVALRRFEIEEASLEEVFVELVGGTAR